MRLRGVIFLPTIGFAFDMGMMGKILTEMPPLILGREVASISSISIVECDLIVYSLQLRGKGGEGAKDAPRKLCNPHQVVIIFMYERRRIRRGGGHRFRRFLSNPVQWTVTLMYVLVGGYL